MMMSNRGSDAARWLAAARAGSKEALGRTLADCQAYLLLIAERELDPDLRAKGGASNLVQETLVEAYLPVTPGAWRQAALLWAGARQPGVPTASADELDADVTLAACAAMIDQPGDQGETPGAVT